MSFEKQLIELQEKVLDYVDDSLSGKITQCQKMKWAMKRFKHDLERSRKKDNPFYMDWNELLKFYRWAKMFHHTKGMLAGKPIDLHVSQLWEMANIFCFKNKLDDARRFREVYIQKARKNAKTQELALVASYIAFLSDQQEEVYIAGWIKEQSELCYNEMVSQIEKAPILKGKFKQAYQRVTVLKNKSVIKALSKEARKRGDGTNPSLSIIDEYGTAHETNEIVDAQKSGMVARKEPLLIYITTAGYDLSFPCFSFYNYCSDILNPETDTENDSIFVAIYELDEGDDIKDENNWVKANPIVTTYYKGMEYLRSELKIALDQPEKMRTFLTKNMDMWVDKKENGFISLEKWNKQEMSENEVKEFLQGAHVYFGKDMSATTDLTAIGWVAVKKGKFLVGQLSFMAEERFTERMSRDKIRFDIFRDRGELILTEGATVNYHTVKQHFVKMANEWGCKSVGIDSWNATYIGNDLIADGYPVIEVSQSIAHLSEPTKKFRNSVYDGTLFHTGDKLLRWSMSNAITQQDHNENIKLSKKISKDRIDPVAAIINAFASAMYDDQTVDLNEVILSDDWSF